MLINNFIKKEGRALPVFILLDVSGSMKAATTNNNVQSICSVGGTVYVLVCQWGGSTDEGGNAVAGGGYIYAVTPQFTNWQ